MRPTDDRFRVRLAVALAALCACTSAERVQTRVEPPTLWLRYPCLTDVTLLAGYTAQLHALVANDNSTTTRLAQHELEPGIAGLLGHAPKRTHAVDADKVAVFGTPQSSLLIAALLGDVLAELGDDGFVVEAARVRGHSVLVVAANRDLGVLYGVFALLRQMQLHAPLDRWMLRSAPKIQRRVLDHCDRDCPIGARIRQAFVLGVGTARNPTQAERPAHALEFYRALNCPADSSTPHCPEVYTP